MFSFSFPLEITVFQKLRRVASSTVFPSSHERCRSIDIAQLRPFCGPSMAVPFPRKTLRYSKSGNSLFMAGSENLERYWKRPGRESKRRRERGESEGIKRRRGRTGYRVSERARTTKEEERYWSDGSVPSGKREERRLVPDPIKRKRKPPCGIAATLLTAT